MNILLRLVLCGVGTLKNIIIQSGELLLNDSSPQPITDIYGVAAVDVSRNSERGNDLVFQGYLDDLNPIAVEPVTGTTAQWAMYKTPSDGYNIVLSEVTTRGYDIATLLDGIGDETYGYGFFEDALAYISAITPQPEVIVTFNLIRPPLLGNYTTTFAEIDYVVATCATAGVTIKFFQLCYELGNQTNDDVFTSGQDIADVTQDVADYIVLTYPTILISADAANWDDNNPHFPTLSADINNVTGIDFVRQYLFLRNPPNATFEQNMAYTTTAVDSMVTYFNSKFTNGQKLYLAQPNVYEDNPFRLKVGEALIYSKLIIDVVKKNVSDGDPISHFTHYNLSRMINGVNHRYAAYFFMVLMRGAMVNNGLISFTLNNADLSVLAVKKGTGAEIYIVNPTSNSVNIDAIKLNGVPKIVTVESYYGAPSTDTATYNLTAGASVVLFPYSLAKIVIPSV